jgi:pyrroline-5-carboxylate reductase
MAVGFIGAGNMASAIIRGLVESGFAAAQEIVVHDTKAEALDRLAAELGIVAAAGNPEVVAQAETVVLAVKPQVLPAVMAEVAAELVAARRLVVSIVGSAPLDKLVSWLSPQTAIVRVMPNVNAQVGAGIAAVAGTGAASRDQIESVVAMMRSVGAAVELDESLFSAFGAIAGSSPAWTFLYIDALARGGVAAGMPKAQALAIAAQAVKGSAELVAAGRAHPWELIDQVSSPGGTTVAGLAVLEDRGLAAAVTTAVRATIAREGEIAGS